MATSHTTQISTDPTNPAARVVRTATTNGTAINTRTEVSPIGDDVFRIQVDQQERGAHHKRGVSRAITFTISRAGLNHLCDVAP